MLPSEETTSFTNGDEISKQTTSIDLEAGNHPETCGKTPELLSKQSNDEGLSLLTVENGGGPDRECELVIKRLNGEKKKMDFKNRLSELSLTPHGHIPATHPTSYLETLINMLKGNIGCGILAMGDAFKNGGLILSPILTILIGVTSIYNQHLLVECSKIVKKKFKLKHNPQFAETVELSIKCGPQQYQKYSSFFQSSVDYFIIITQLGVCCVYVLFISKSILQITNWYKMELDFYKSLLVSMVPVLISSLIKNLKFIAWLSAAANVCMVGGLIIILYYCSFDFLPLSEVSFFGQWSTIPLFFGTSIFSFEGISLVLPLQQEMKNPKQFSTTFGALNVGMGIVTGLIILTGFMGYLKFGDNVLGSLTLNLPSDFPLSKLVIFGMVFGITCTYTLQFYVPVEIIWPNVINIFGPFKSPLLWEMGLRVILVLLTFVAAGVIPHLGLFISLMGAVASTFLALVFPPLCDMAMAFNGRDGGGGGGRSRWRLVADVGTLVVAAIGFFTGTYASVREIIYAFQNGTAAAH